MLNEIETIQNHECINDNIQFCKDLLTKYGKILHPNHYLQVNLKEHLVAMYGWRLKKNNEFYSVVVECLEQKLELCWDILKILNIVQPGRNRSRAMILYEIYTAKTALIKFNWNEINNHSDQLNESSKLLEEFLEVLEWEDVSSIEHRLANICRQISNSISTKISDISAQ